MPVDPADPGDSVEAQPSGVPTITGVPTAVTAFLGYFSHGPMNTPMRILSGADLDRNFGPLIATSEAGYGIRQFYANGGDVAWVVRVASSPTTSPLQSASIQIRDAPGGDTILEAAAKSPGTWGNSIRLAVDYGTANLGKSFNLTVTLVDTSIPPVALLTEMYPNLTLDPSDSNFALEVVNKASDLVQLQLVGNVSATALPAPTGTISTDVSSVNPSTLSGSMTVTLGATELCADLTLPGSLTSLMDLAVALESRLRALGSPAVMPDVTVALVPGSGTSEYVGPGPEVVLQISAAITQPNQALTFSGSLADALGLDSAAIENVQRYALGLPLPATPLAAVDPVAGGDGEPPDAKALQGDRQTKTGIYSLDNVDQFDILCLPDVMSLADEDAFTVISAAESYCASRRAFLVVDVPQNSSGGVGMPAQRDSVAGVLGWLANNSTLRSCDTALYFPRPQIPDPLNGNRPRSVAVSGTIAGLYAKTDSTRGVWKVAAGTTAILSGVSTLACDVTDAESEVLNALGINCLRRLPVYGIVCWGARTLDGADQIESEWKYIPVRRLALYLEASLYQGTQWAVFEPNGEPLWAQIRLDVGSFMQDLFRQGAFQGSTPTTAYFVKCDSNTTTQADIDRGVVNILVGFAPLEPAEFVVLQIQQLAGQQPHGRQNRVSTGRTGGTKRTGPEDR